VTREPALAATPLWEINPADRVLGVAVLLLRGELALARGDQASGLAALRDAVAAEDRLAYNEPPDWPLPVRTYLGAALLAAGRADEAITVYRTDLAKYPENGWSLHGLAQAQRDSGDPAAATNSERRLAKAWQWADTPLVASRF
jgi:tetratricopeptide (TPR) repeat protein